jgi:hypothetical protein
MGTRTKNRRKILVTDGTRGSGIRKVSAATAARAAAFDRATAQAPFSGGFEIVTQAVTEGIIDEDMVDHFVALWEAKPTETEKYLVSMGLKVDDKAATVTFAQRSAAAKAKAKQRVSAATEKRVNQYLDTETMLDQAILAGVIDGSLREHYSQCSAADPQGTREHLNNLGLNVMGVRQESRAVTASAKQEDYPSAHLTAAERGRIAATRRDRIVDGG